MQPPTCTRLRIRSVHDAEVILHAVFLGRLPMVTRRLDDEERLYLKSGCIYVWEERSSNPLEATGQEIQRFTEGRSWGPSRARDDFLLYYEKESASRSSLLLRSNLAGLSQLIKQTYSVFVFLPNSPPRKWHLNAYYTQDSVDRLRTIEQIPELMGIVVPAGQYVCARTSSARRPARAAPRAPSETASSQTSSWSDSSPGPSPGPSPHYPITAEYSSGSLVPLMTAPPHSVPTSLYPSHRRLAPLEYLQNIPPNTRNPIDDEALQQFPRNI